MKSAVARSASSRHVQQAKQRTGSVLAALDLFKVAPQPRFVPEFYVSKRSRGATACVLVATLVYLAITVQRFVDVAPVIKVTPTATAHVSMPAPDVAIAVQYGPGYRQIVNDTDLLTVRALQGTTYDGNERREYQDIGAEVVTNTWASAHALDTWMPVQRAALQGQLSSPKFQFLQIDLLSSNVSKLLELGNAGTRIFAYLRLHFDTGDEHVVTLFWYPLETMQVRSEVIMQIIDVVEMPNYLTSFLSHTSTVLSYHREKVYNTQTQTVVGDRNAFFTLWIRLDSVSLDKEMRSPTIFDAVSSVGALFTTVVGVLGLYFTRYNTKKFFARNPDWDALDVTDGPYGAARNHNTRRSTINPLKEQELTRVTA